MSTSKYPHLREAQRLVWRPDCTLEPTARHIACYLMNRMNEDYDGAYPSIGRMAEDLGLKRDAIIEHTKAIVDSGLFERRPGRKGMYTYRITSMEALVSALDLKLEEWAKGYWANQKQLNGGSGRPVGNPDQSKIPTPTSRKSRLQAVGNSDPERLTLKGQVKGQYSAHPTGEPETPTQIVSASVSLPLESQAGSELHLQELEVAKCDEGISWVEPASIPPTYQQGVWFDRTLGKLSLVNNEKGRAFYRGLRDEPYPIDAIKSGLTAACVRAPSVKARSGGYEALVRTYVGYALEKQTAAAGASRARETAFQRPRAFQP